MKMEEVRSKTDAELEYDLGRLQRDLFDSRLKAAAETTTDPMRIRTARRGIARIKTVLHERTVGVRGQEPR